MLDTRGRVPSQTQNEINERIRAEMARSVRYLERRMDEIPAHLRALDEEWDIERAIEANASALALFGVLIAALRGNNRWLMLPVAVTGFLVVLIRPPRSATQFAACGQMLVHEPLTTSRIKGAVA